MHSDAELVREPEHGPGQGPDGQREQLPGGGVGGAVRVGDTVHRPAGAWSAAVHLLLDHLHRHGLDGVPRAHGFEMRDGRSVEVLSYLPGDCAEAYDPWPDWAYSESLLTRVVEWTRRFHDAVRDFRPSEPLPWRGGTRQLQPDEIVCHHDIAPYNVIVDTSKSFQVGEQRDTDVQLVGVIDWDMAGPGIPLQDLAHLTWNFLPPCIERSAAPAPEVARRVHLVVRHYGDIEPAELLTSVGQRMQRSARVIRTRAEAGDAGMRNLVESGRLAALEQRLGWWRSITDDVRAAL